MKCFYCGSDSLTHICKRNPAYDRVPGDAESCLDALKEMKSGNDIVPAKLGEDTAWLEISKTIEIFKSDDFMRKLMGKPLSWDEAWNQMAQAANEILKEKVGL